MHFFNKKIYSQEVWFYSKSIGDIHIKKNNNIKLYTIGYWIIRFILKFYDWMGNGMSRNLYPKVVKVRLILRQCVSIN